MLNYPTVKSTFKPAFKCGVGTSNWENRRMETCFSLTLLSRHNFKPRRQEATQARLEQKEEVVWDPRAVGPAQEQGPSLSGPPSSLHQEAELCNPHPARVQDFQVPSDSWVLRGIFVKNEQSRQHSSLSGSLRHSFYPRETEKRSWPVQKDTDPVRLLV